MLLIVKMLLLTLNTLIIVKNRYLIKFIFKRIWGRVKKIPYSWPNCTILRDFGHPYRNQLFSSTRIINYHNNNNLLRLPVGYKRCTDRKLLGSPVFQFSKVTGRPLAIQKKVPSSPWSVPEVQKCSCPKPKSLMCFSSLSLSSCELILARCIPWYLQYCEARYQFA